MATTNKQIDFNFRVGKSSQKISFVVPESEIEVANSQIGGTGFVITKCDPKQDSAYVTDVKPLVSGDWKFETKRPKLPEWMEYNTPKKDQPTPMPVYTRGVNCGTGINATNLDLSFHCNFVEEIKIKSCLFEMKSYLQVYLRSIQKYVIYIMKVTSPFMEWLFNIMEFVCAIMYYIKELICFIKLVIQCVMDTISSIIRLINWILTLGPRILMKLMSCVTEYINKIIKQVLDILKSIFDFKGIFSCVEFECDIGDLLSIGK